MKDENGIEIIGGGEEPESASDYITEVAGDTLQEMVEDHGREDQDVAESPRKRFMTAMMEYRDKVNRIVALEKQLPRTDMDSDITRQFQRLGTDLFGDGDKSGKPKSVRQIRFEIEKLTKRMRGNEMRQRKKLMRTVADGTETKAKRLAAAKNLGIIGGKKPKPGDLIDVRGDWYRIGKHGEHRRVNREELEESLVKELEHTKALKACASGK